MAPEPPAYLPMLRGERVWLRGTTRADLAGEAPAVSDAETGHFLGLKLPISPEGSEQFAQQVLSQQGQTIWFFTICLLGEDRGIGTVNLRKVDRENGSAELAIVISDKSLQGQGLGTDALNCLVDFGFGELRLERIYLHVFDFNARARRSYEKAGFQTDATLRRSRFHRGQHHDVLLMSILRDDWLALDRRRAWDPAPTG
ncbi:MAG TPA: GNAT family protein [Candidatus Limnocylindria bacterium]|jgi:RimJ/RimL family protein N-acetyltransferase|nr:GNAT family protein [Candidatus Limnocylindria bacterium]